jgi:hypothetical protein
MMITTRMSSRTGRAAWWGLCQLPILLAVQALWAGTGGVDVLPMGNRAPSGLRLAIDTRWVDGTGYRPVTIRLLPVPPGRATADRRVRVVLAPRSWQTGLARTSVACTLELAQGSLFAERTIAVPCGDGWNSVRVDTYEDGRRLRDLSVAYLSWPVRGYYQWTEASPSIVIIAAQAPPRNLGVPPPSPNPQALPLPDIRALAGAVPLNRWTGVLDETAFQTSQPIESAALLRLLGDLPRLAVLPPVDLPDDWIAWTSVDLVIISWEDLRQLQQEFPAKWQALRSWAATGPGLCVFGVAADVDELARLERDVGLAPLVEASQPWGGWSAPGPESFGKPLDHPGNLAFGQPSPMPADRTNVADLPPGAPHFLTRPLEQGQLVALTVDPPFPGRGDIWSWLLTELGSQNLMWYRRHGLSLQRENREFWNWLIPGVGRAPVTAFVLLISLFVVAIGPVNYWWLRRHQRLYLLLVTVPAGAVCVTAGLMLYALAADGLSVRVRVRSLCDLDQRTGRAVNWSRQTYYAGIAPRDGLRFPADAAVYPLEFRPTGGLPWEDGGLVNWDTGQHLARGYLPSRTTVQFLVVESRPSVKGLDFTGLADGTATPRVSNRLGVDVPRLVVRDLDGRCWSASDLAAAGSALLAAVDPAAEARVWNQLLLPALPQYPEGFDPSQVENASAFLIGNFGAWRATADDQLPAPSLREGLLERRWQEVLANDFVHLPPRGYLALVAEPVETSLGISGVRQEASIHVVRGLW